MSRAQRPCESCGSLFTPKNKRQRFDSGTCRTRANRREQRSGGQSQPAQDVERVPRGPSDLERAVVADLEAAAVLDTFFGQLAVNLAARIDGPDDVPLAALSRELRTVMALALAAAPRPDAEPDIVDEVAMAREAARQKALAMALGPYGDGGGA